MRSIMSMIPLELKGSVIATHIANLITRYGQLILALFILVALFFFYDTFIQSELARFMEAADFRPPTIVH